MPDTAFPTAPLGDVCSLITDGSHFSPVPQEEGHPIVNAKDIPNGHVDLSTCTRISEKDWQLLRAQNCSPRVGDVLLSKDGTIGRVVHYREDLGVVLLSSVAILRPEGQLDSEFLAQCLRSHIFDSQLYGLQSGSALKRLVLSDIRKIAVPVPEPATQSEIAEILSTVDEAIEQTEALIAKTRQIKAGLMHDLFTCGVTPDGQLRPPHEEAPQFYKESPLGWIPKEWDCDLLANLYVEPARNGLYKPVQYHGRGPLMIQMGNMFSGMYVDLDGVSRVDVTPLELSTYGLRDGDLLFGRRSLVFEGAGRSVLVANMVEPTTFESSIIRVRLDQNKLNSHFAALYLSTEIAYRDRRRYIRQVAVSGVAGPDVKQFKMALPDLDEQCTIVMLIDSAEKRAEENRSELKKLQDIKRGLMNDLLSGKVTVALRYANEAVA